MKVIKIEHKFSIGYGIFIQQCITYLSNDSYRLNGRSCSIEWRYMAQLHIECTYVYIQYEPRSVKRGFNAFAKISTLVSLRVPHAQADQGRYLIETFYYQSTL